MADKMLIDATHPEETRVVVLRGNRVEEFDFESANRKQLRGNIYLAKVTRVEPSLQAAFVDYGGNRHGFLAFSEIHPDYYQIPVADRQALLAEEARAQRDADEEADNRGRRRGRRHRRRGAHRHREVKRSEPVAGEADRAPGVRRRSAAESQPGEAAAPQPDGARSAPTAMPEAAPKSRDRCPPKSRCRAPPKCRQPTRCIPRLPPSSEPAGRRRAERARRTMPKPADRSRRSRRPTTPPAGEHVEMPATVNGNGDDQPEEEAVESVGGADALEEAQERMPRFRRQYKIQEVIKRRQVMLVQVVKEERGTKGAALTTYLSLAGRYSVLMPNTARGGGISRKITSAEDRSRLKEIAQELEVPEGMGVILRTAGASRTKTEVKRDFEYLLRLWETVRDLTLKSMAPTLVYEEGSLTKRSIRDLYTKDIDEIVVAGDEGYKEARDFMRMLMPSHAKNVKLYKDTQPLFTRYGIESQLDAMFSPTVQLRSGGYIVINQAEALVAIDVNSGRATREHHIEDTALKTNMRGGRGDRAPAAPARPRRADRHRLHRHGRGPQQPHGRAQAEGRAQARPRPHPGRPHLAFRPAGNVAPAHPHLGAGKLDREMPGLRRLRPRALGVVGGAAIAARDRGNADQGRDAQSDRAHARRSRALCAQPQARAFARRWKSASASRSRSRPMRP